MTDRVFMLDSRGERQVALLRLTGAAVCLGAAIFIALLRPPLVGWVVAIVGLLVALGWTIAGRRGLSRAKASEKYFVALRADALEIQDGPKSIRIAWTDVLSAAVDEERLVVVVRRREEEPLHVEPRFKGVSVYDLAKAIDERADRGASRP